MPNPTQNTVSGGYRGRDAVDHRRAEPALRAPVRSGYGAPARSPGWLFRPSTNREENLPLDGRGGVTAAAGQESPYCGLPRAAVRREQRPFESWEEVEAISAEIYRRSVGRRLLPLFGDQIPTRRIMGTSVAQTDATYGHLPPDSEDYLRGLLDAYDDVYGLSADEAGR